MSMLECPGCGGTLKCFCPPSPKDVFEGKYRNVDEMLQRDLDAVANLAQEIIDDPRTYISDSCEALSKPLTDHTIKPGTDLIYEIKKLRNENRVINTQLSLAYGQLTDVEIQLEQYKADALRYRWLRQQNLNDYEKLHQSAEELDATIDLMISRKNKGKKYGS